MAKLTPAQVKALKVLGACEEDEKSGLFKVKLFISNASKLSHGSINTKARIYFIHKSPLSKLVEYGLAESDLNENISNNAKLTQAGRDALAELEAPAQPAPEFEQFDKVHVVATNEHGMVIGKQIHPAQERYLVGFPGGNTERFDVDELTPCDCQPDPATCDVCGEHQPHVATDSDNDVDVCDECADMAVENNRPRGNRIVWRNRQQAIYDCALHIVRERHVGFASAAAWFDVNVGKYAMLNTGNVADNTNAVRTKFGIDVDKFAHANFGTLALEVEESAQPDQPYTRPAETIGAAILPAFTMVSGELKTFAIPARITHVSSRLLLPAPQEYRPVDADLWQQPAAEVDSLWIGQNLDDPDYKVWLGEKGLAKPFVIFIKDSRGDYSVYDTDALTVLKYVAPQSSARIWRLSYPKHAMSNQAWELSDVLELLRENHVSYMVMNGDETEIQFKVRGDMPAPTPPAHVIKRGGKVMKFSADKNNRRLAG